MSLIDTQALHFFSKLAYLNTAPAMEREGAVTVGALCDYYAGNPIGKAYLSARFGDILREYDCWKDFVEEGGGAYRDWIIRDILDDNRPEQSGLYAASYMGSDSVRIVAFRGSELLGNRYYRNDYVNDLALAYQSPTPQQAAARRYWSAITRTGGEAIGITGHSLGGNLAVYAAAAAPKSIRTDIVSCAAFNAPGFPKEFQKDTGLEAVADRIILVQNRYDPVSSMLENPVTPLVVESAYIPAFADELSAEDIFYPHSNFVYKQDENGELVLAEPQEKCFFCNCVHTLTELVMLLPAKIREDLANVLLAALYRAPSGEDARRYLLEAVTRHMSRSTPSSVGGELSAMAVAYAAELAGKADVKSLYSAVTQRGGTPDLLSLARTLSVLLEIFIYLDKKGAGKK